MAGRRRANRFGVSRNILSLSHVSKSHDGRPLIDDATCGIDLGDKVAIIGANGVGKSTLLRIIAGQESPDGGQVALRKGTRIAFVEQVPTLDLQLTVREALAERLAELRRCIAAYEDAATAMRDDAGELLARIEQLGGWDYHHRIDNVAAQLGLQDLDAPIDRLSGGERRRVALAQQVIEEPDLLLLDEPTNHLDAETVAWLEGWLQRSRAAVVLVTHDRYFLDNVVHQLFELRDGSLRAYAGNYTDYLVTRAVEEAHRGRTRHRQLRTLMAELDWARRSPKARTTKSKARLERIDRAKEEVAKLAGEEFVADFRFGKPPRLGGTILEFEDVHMAFGDGPALLAGLSFKLRRGERIGVIGPNGCGKTTLLRLLTGELTPTAGSIKVGLNTRVAYLDQHRTTLDPTCTVRETVAPDGADLVVPGGGSSVRVQAWLSRFGFEHSTHDRPVGTLSGGERNRLAIARFLLEDANLLVFDEPTNDLDIPTLTNLEEAVAQFEGCVLLVTHDRYLLDKVATGIMAFERDTLGPGAVTFVQGSYSHYADLRLRDLERDRQEAARQRTDAKHRARTDSNKAAPPPKKKGLTYAERLELEGMEPALEDAEARVADLQEELADPQHWAHGGQRGSDIQAQLNAAEEHTTKLYTRWEVLLARHERAD